jgi:hypothetical protein
MDPELVKRALRIYRRSHPTYPAPLQIRIIECTSPSGQKHPVVVLEDMPGLLAALRIRPCGRLEEVVPFPIRVEVPGQPGRYRLSLIGLPDLLCNGWESKLSDRDRILACARWKQTQADQVEDVIKYFTQQIERLIPQSEVLKATLKRFTGDPNKNKDRRAVTIRIQEIAREVAAARLSLDALPHHLGELRSQIEKLKRRATG